MQLCDKVIENDMNHDIHVCADACDKCVEDKFFAANTYYTAVCYFNLKRSKYILCYMYETSLSISDLQNNGCVALQVFIYETTKIIKTITQ